MSFYKTRRIRLWDEVVGRVGWDADVWWWQNSLFNSALKQTGSIKKDLNTFAESPVSSSPALQGMSLHLRLIMIIIDSCGGGGVQASTTSVSLIAMMEQARSPHHSHLSPAPSMITILWHDGRSFPPNKKRLFSAPRTSARK